MERRRAKRIAVNVDVQVSVMDDAPASAAQSGPADNNIERVALATRGSSGLFDAEFDAEIVDLSINGARLTSRTQPPLLSRVSLAFDFKEFRYVHATALVMWRTSAPSANGEYGFGVLFEAMPLTVRLGIENAVNEVDSNKRP